MPTLDLNQPLIIRSAKKDDLQHIKTWLVDENRRDIEGNFLCNWEVIQDAFEGGELLVGALDDDLPIAFQLGGLLTPGILQVKHEYRGFGIGRKMVRHSIEFAKNNDEFLLYIQCTPSSSIGFWKKMEFVLIPDETTRNFFAYQVLEKPLELPPKGTEVAVSIKFFPEERRWNSDALPYAEGIPRAVVLDNGSIALAQRVLFHQTALSSGGDAIVEIKVNGDALYCDKAKYPEARDVGICQCRNGYYIDLITPCN